MCRGQSTNKRRFWWSTQSPKTRVCLNSDKLKVILHVWSISNSGKEMRPPKNGRPGEDGTNPIWCLAIGIALADVMQCCFKILTALIASEMGTAMKQNEWQCGRRALTEVAEGSGLTTSRSVAVLDTSHLEELLGHTSGDESSTTGSRDEAHTGGTALASHLARDGVGLANSVTPVSTADGDDRELGVDDSSTDGCCHFLGALHTETNMAVSVANSNEGLEARALTSTSLLLDGHDLQDLILQSRSQEEVDDLRLLWIAIKKEKS